MITFCVCFLVLAMILYYEYRRAETIKEEKKSGKLTYGEIVRLVNREKTDSISDKYNIKWLGNEPGKVFEFEIDAKDITITRGDVPKPRKVFLVGEYVAYTNGCNDDFFEEVEFGDVYLRTIFKITEFRAIFDSEETNIQEIRKWSEKINEWVVGRVGKEGLSFDMVATLPKPYKNIEIFRIWPTQIDFPKTEEEEKTGEVVVKMIWDYFHINFLNK